MSSEKRGSSKRRVLARLERLGMEPHLYLRTVLFSEGLI